MNRIDSIDIDDKQDYELAKFLSKHNSVTLLSRKNIKNILLDQKIVSGIGNIYASEILFSSKINPLIVGKKLKLYQIKNLYKYSKIVLKNAILKGGSSIRDFKNVVGN